jgi:tungstate transport system permease protein
MNQIEADSAVSDSPFVLALRLMTGFDPALIEIVSRSLMVSLSALLLATVIGLPLGALVAIARFPGRGAIAVTLSAFMGLPPVVVGLVVYLLLSRSGPLGILGLLYTPTAMVIAQAILVTPIIAAVTRQTIDDLWREYREQLLSLGATPVSAVVTLIWDARHSLSTAILAGFGRATAEVGAVMIVGGNIDHVTRTMTTAIVLETSRGNLALALALGLILISLSLVVNGAVFFLRDYGPRRD